MKECNAQNFNLKSKTTQRELLSADTIDIIPTTSWQKFEERQYFDGKRTITLLLGGANVIKDAIEEKLIPNIEYELSSGSNQSLSPIHSDNYLYLKEGWSLISTPINSEIDVEETFSTQDLSYQFKDGKWIKNPEILKPNEGMWINYNFNIYVHFNEYNTTESYEFNSTILNSSWNLVGAVDTINLNSDEFESVWAFDNVTKEWVNNPNKILRGYGFWVKR